MKKFLSIVLFVFIMLPVYSSSWVQIGDKAYIDCDSLSVYVDDYNIQHKEQKIFWLKSLNDGGEIYKRIEKEFNTKIWYIMTQYIVNTSNKTNSIKSLLYYDLKGNVVFNYTVKDVHLQWESIVPNTNSEFFYDIVTHPDELIEVYKYQQKNK